MAQNKLVFLGKLPLGDAAQCTLDVLFPDTTASNTFDAVVPDSLILESVEPSSSSFLNKAWPDILQQLDEYFKQCLNNKDGAKNFWDALQEQQRFVDKPHQKLVTILLDRARLGCVKSASVSLRWFALAGGMQGLSAAKGALLTELFQLLKPNRLENMVNPSKQNMMRDEATACTAVEDFLQAISQFVQNHTDFANDVATVLSDLLVQLSMSVKKITINFSKKMQQYTEEILVGLSKVKICGVQRYLVTPLIEKLVPLLTMSTVSKGTGILSETIKSQHNMALRVVAAIATHSSAADRIYALVRHIARQPPTKIDFRRLAIDGIEKLLPQLPKEMQKQFFVSIGVLATGKLVQHRVFAIEIADRLLRNTENSWKMMDCSEIHPSNSPSIESNVDLNVKQHCKDNESKVQAPSIQEQGRAKNPLIHALVERVKDKIPQVRKASIKALVAALESADSKYLSNVLSVVDSVFGVEVAAAREMIGEDGNPVIDRQNMEHPIMVMVLNRLGDDKPSVRVFAIKLAEIFGKLDSIYCDFSTIAQMCEDSSVSVRRQAISTISSLGEKYPDNTMLQDMWVQCVLSRIKDNEKTIQTLCASIMQKKMFDAIQEAAFSESSANKARLQSHLVSIVAKLDLMLLSCLQHGINLLVVNGYVNAKFVKALQTSMSWSSHMATVAWALMKTIAANDQTTKLMDPNFVVLEWENSVDEVSQSEQTAEFILGTLMHVVDRVSSHAATSLYEHLIDLLKTFRCSPGLISSLIHCCIKLTDCKNASVSKAHRAKAAWMIDLASLCDTCLCNFVFSRRELNTDAVVAHLHTLGELAIIGVRDSGSQSFFKIRQSTIVALKTLITPASDGDERKVDGDLTIRAFAFVALGKMAFRSQALAKSCIGVFISQLMTTTEPVIRNNILIVLGDLCRHFTGLVDPYVANMAHCLGDHHIGVRKNALLLLTELLLEDFIKWRGPLVYQFLSLLMDPSGELCELAHQAIFSLFSGRDKNIVVNGFVGLIHVLNNSPLSRRDMDVQDGTNICTFFEKFYGQSSGRRFRYRLYRAILQEMDGEQKFKISARLTADVLGAVVDGTFSVQTNDCSSSSYNVLQDVLAILSSRAIQISHAATGNAAAATGASAIGEELSAEVAIGAVKDKLLSQMSRKNAMQNTIPILIALRTRLQTTRSPLVKDVNDYIVCLFRYNRSDVMKALAEDPQLAAEIEYDLKKLEKQRRERQSQKRRRTSSILSNRHSINGNITNSSTPVQSNKRHIASLPGGLATPFSARSVMRSPLGTCSAAKVSGGSVVRRRMSNMANIAEPIKRNLDLSQVFTDSSNMSPPASATKARPNGRTRSPAHKRTFKDGGLASIEVFDD